MKGGMGNREKVMGYGAPFPRSLFFIDGWPGRCFAAVTACCLHPLLFSGLDKAPFPHYFFKRGK